MLLVHVGISVGEERQLKKGKQKKCALCGGFNANASKWCKGCGTEIKIKTFDREKLKNKKKTHPTQQRKTLEYQFNYLGKCPQIQYAT